ncbi:MAG: hypothetical protein ACK5MI_00725 [Mangrovibacterium sp.]
MQSVIKITTARDGKDRFGRQVYAKGAYSNAFVGNQALNLNYRNKGLDIFNSVVFEQNNRKIPIINEQEINAVGITHYASAKEINKTKYINPTLGLSYLTKRKQSLEIRYSYTNAGNRAKLYNEVNSVNGSNYKIINNSMISVLYQYEDQDIILMKTINITNYHNLYIGVSYKPIVGIWKPSIEINMSKQWLNLEETKETYNNPRFFAYFYNTFKFKKNWTLFADISFHLKGMKGLLK